MQLQIVAPDQTHKYQVVWIELNTVVGNMIVQPGHAPMVVLLAPHKPITYRMRTGKQETITPRQGVAEITRDKTTVIINVT